MRGLLRSSGNTELTDSRSQSLTTSGPQRALHERYGSAKVLVLTRSVSINAALSSDFGRPPAACVFVSRHLLRHLTVLLEKQSKQLVNESSVLFDDGLLATFIEWSRFVYPLYFWTTVDGRGLVVHRHPHVGLLHTSRQVGRNPRS
jgi:hypothetical protein